MLIDRPRETNWETLETLVESEEGALVAALASGRQILLFIPRSPERGRLEAERAAYLRGPGIPVIQPLGDGSWEALLLAGAETSRPLRSAPPLPDTVWRAALRRLVSALSHVHGKGFVHGRITRDAILADPSGEFWIHGWGDARPAVGRSPFHVGLDDVASDLRALGSALVQHLGSSDEADPAAVQRAVSRLATSDAELARVLGRLVATDPRESYETATEVLADLGEPDESMQDPLAQLRFVGRRRLVRKILAQVERAGTRHAQFVAFEVAGPPGSGRTRVLEETASQARERGFVVMTAHGGAPNQPWGALGDFARQMLARLPADHPLRGERGVRVLVGDVPSPAADPESPGRSDGASAALADLLTAAFSDRRGLLLLDDADALSSHALQAWRSLVRQISAASGPPQSPRALVVTSSSQRLRYERDAAVETVELGDLSRRHVVSLLAALLTEPGKAALLADEILAVSGGRPGDIAAHLREMLERRALLQVGPRFHLADPGQQALPAAGADRLRRAVQAAGREGAALAEAVAVAGRLRLTRDVLGDLAELSGPRLQAAAEAAVAAGLLCRDGAAWRVRTGSFRARIEAMLPDERRRSLHREILSRLVDAAEPDWPAIAHHGRSCGDSRAAEWTRTAFAQLRAAGRYDEAATHLDDARTSLDPAALDIELHLLHVETLLHAGRLDDATRSAADIARDPRSTPRERGRALLALAQLHRYDQAWTRVLAVELPEDCGDPLVLARIRLLRATAHIFRGRYDLADREERLALAEVEGGEGAGWTEVDQLLDESRYLRALFHKRLDEAAGAALRHLRRVSPRPSHIERAYFLVALANVDRCRSRLARARAVLRRAREIAKKELCDNPLVLTWIHTTRWLIESRATRPEHAIRAMQAATLCAYRAGLHGLAANRRLYLILEELESKSASLATYDVAGRLLADLDGQDVNWVAVVAPTLSRVALFLGDVRALRSISARLERSRSPELHRSVATLSFWTIQLMLDTVDDVPCLSSMHTAEDLRTFVSTASDMLRHSPGLGHPTMDGPLPPIHAVWALASHALRRGWANTEVWPKEWDLVKVTAQLGASEFAHLVSVDFATSLLIFAENHVSEEQRGLLVQLVLGAGSRLPRPVEWRRRLALARVAWAQGRFRTADRLTHAATEAAMSLKSPTLEHLGPVALVKALTAIETMGRLIPSLTPARKSSFVGVSRPLPEHAAPACWVHTIEEVLSAHVSLVTSPDEAELREFQALLSKAGDGSAATAAFTVGGLRVERVHRSHSEAEIESLGCRVTTWAHGGGSACVLSPFTFEAMTSGREVLRHLAMTASGTLLRLPSLLAAGQDRAQIVRSWELRILGDEVRFSADTQVELTAYSWPGGLTELLTVLEEIRRRGLQLVDADGLRQLGWRRRISSQTCLLGQSHSDAQLLMALGPAECASSTELAGATKQALRSTVRRLGRLVDAGVVARRGRGRATRYWVP